MAQSIYKSPAGERAIMAWYDSALARWPVPYETFNVPTRLGDTFVLASGASGKESDAPLILLHGAGTNSAMWAGDIATYSRQYRVYAVDLLGEPGKSAPNRPAWDGPAYAEWLADVLDALKVEKATLLGLSQGGWAALKFAMYQPRRVEKLALLNPAGIAPDKLSFVIQAIPLSLLGPWGIHRLNRLLFAGQPVPQEVDEATTLMMTHFKTRVGVLPLFTEAELRCLSMPVLLLLGARDTLRDGPKIAACMQKLVPRLTTIVIPEAGHALMNTPPHILPFLVPDRGESRLS